MANEWIQVNSSSSTTIGVKKDGTLWASGLNWHGATGQNTTQGVTKELTQIGIDADWKDARVQSSHVISDGLRRKADWAIGIKTDGSLWVWGSGGEPWSGFLRENPVLQPQQVSPAGSGWKKVLPSLNSFYFLALKDDGSLWETPSSRIDSSKWLWAETGSDSDRGFVGIKEDGTLWGGSIKNGITPIDEFYTWIDTSIEKSRGSLRLAVKSDGTLWFSGNVENFRGGTDLTQLGSDSDWVKVEASIQYVVAMKQDGSLWGWGVNYENRLGIIEHKDNLIPDLVPLNSLDSGWGDYEISPLNIILYDEPPTLSLLSVEPKSGLDDGGDNIILRVSDADPSIGASVTFDGVAATNVNVVNEIRIDCISPTGTVGFADVTITQGTESSTLAQSFEYISELPPEEPPPPSTSSRPVTVDFFHNFYGSDIAEVSLITVDGNGDQIGDTAWTYTGPSENLWKPASVEVETLDLPETRLAFKVLNNSGSFRADWALDSVSIKENGSIFSSYDFESDSQGWLTNTEKTEDPAQALSTSTNIGTGSTSNRFNRTSGGTGSSGTGPSSGEGGSGFYIYAETSSSSSGYNYWAFSSEILTDKFRLSGIDKNKGTESGGENVTITGENFSQSTDAFIKFGDEFATNVSVVSSTEITCTTPKGTGNVDILIIQDQKSSRLTDAYTYLPSRIINISFEHNYNGDDIGEASLMLIDENEEFIGGPIWTYNGPSEDLWKIESIDAEIFDNTQIRLLFESVVDGTNELADWAVTNVRIKEVNGTLAYYDFSDNYHGWRSFSFDQGAASGTPPSGLNFSDAIFFNTSTTNFSRNIGTTETSGTGPSSGPNGGFYIHAEPSGSTDTGRTFWAFSPLLSLSPLTVNNINVTEGIVEGGTLVEIDGENFNAGASVKFGESFSEHVNVIDSNTIECVSPPGSGTVPVTILQGTESATSPSLFDYIFSEKITINFSHHFFGNNIKEVKLYIVDDSGDPMGHPPVWWYRGPSEDIWKTVEIDAPIFDLEKFHLSFLVIKFGTPSIEEADWALDEITISKDNTVLFSHDFEGSNDNWTTNAINTESPTSIFSTGLEPIETTTVETGLPNFKRNDGQTPTLNTGPSSGSDGGFYIYAEASSTAGTTNSERIPFWAVSPLIGLGEPTLNTISPSKGTLNANTTVEIKGNGFVQGANVLFGSTPATNVEVIDGQTIQCIGPSSSVPQKTSVTIDQPNGSSTESNFFEYVTTESIEVTFEHHFFGSDLKKAELIVVDEAANAIGNPVWTYTGPSEDSWKPVSLNIETPEQSRLVFKSTSEGESADNADWAIDLIDVRKGGSAILFYDFESGPQDWETTPNAETEDLKTAFSSREKISSIYSQISSGRFNIESTSTSTSSTGPSAGADGGNYIYAEPSGYLSVEEKNFWAFSPIIGIGDFFVSDTSGAEGPVSGGNTITIFGKNFKKGLSATIGGSPVTDINVLSGNKFEGTVPAGSLGLEDIVVSQDGVNEIIINGYEYVESAVLDISFQHNYYGSALNGVNLYKVSSTGEILGDAIWTYSGPSENLWKSVSFSTTTTAPNIFLAFLVDTSSYQADWALDDVNILQDGTSIIQTGFENDGAGWTSSDTASIDSTTAFANKTPISSSFIRTSGSTTSTSTGPTEAAEGSFYIYSEASDGNDFLWAFSPQIPGSSGGSSVINIESISPRAGTLDGGDTVTITGINFDTGSPASVSFGGVAATNVTVVSGTEITCTTPPVTLGETVDVELTQNGVTRVLKRAFLYSDATEITINFQHAYIGSDLGEVALFFVDGDGEIIGNPVWTYDGPQTSGWVSASASGLVTFNSVRLAFRAINPTGDFKADWAVDAIDINGTLYDFENGNDGWTTNSTQTTISSDAFSGKTEISTSLNYGRFNRRTGNTPSSSTGPSSAASGAYYLYTEASSTSENAHFWAFSPEIELGGTSASDDIELIKIVPEKGGEQGGTLVSITGQKFADVPTDVTFDGTQATNVTVESDTKITCTTPPGTSTVNVEIIQDSGASATATNIFEYAQSEQLLVDFQHHFNGPSLEEVSLYVLDSGGNIISGPAWTFSGSPSDTWISETVNVDIFDNLEENVRLAFKVSNSNREQSEWSIDSITISDNGSIIVNSEFEDIFHGWRTSTKDTKIPSEAFASNIIMPDFKNSGTGRFLRTDIFRGVGPDTAISGQYYVISGVGGEENLWLFSPVVFNPTT